MCDVAVAAAQTLTREDLELATEDDLPTPGGLVVLPHPLLVKSITGDIGDDRAYTWRVPSQIQRPSPNGRSMQDAPAIRMSAYHDSYGPTPSWTSLPRPARRALPCRRSSLTPSAARY